MSERIVIEIDDSQLVSVIGNLGEVSDVSKKVLGPKPLHQQLPTINRELRVILGQLPGMRGAIQGIFLVRRELRGFDKGGIGGMTFWLATVANIFILLRELRQIQRKLERQRTQFERVFAQMRGISRDELKVERENMKQYLKAQPR